MNQIKRFLEKSSLTYTDLAKLIYSLNEHEYVFSGPISNNWYKYDGTTWHRVNNDFMKKEIKDIISKIFSGMQSILEKEPIKQNDSLINQLENKKDNISFIVKVLEECQGYFFDSSYSRMPSRL